MYYYYTNFQLLFLSDGKINSIIIMVLRIVVSL